MAVDALRVRQAVARVRVHFFWLDTPYAVYPFISLWPLRLSLLWAITNNATMTVHMQTFVGCITRSGISGSYGSSIFTLLRNHKTVFQSNYTSYIPTCNIQGFQFLHIPLLICFLPIIDILADMRASFVAQLVKNLPAIQETWVGKIPWKWERLPTPVFWPGEFHGLYSPWGHKESDMTERLSLHKQIWNDASLSFQLTFPAWLMMWRIFSCAHWSFVCCWRIFILVPPLSSCTPLDQSCNSFGFSVPHL